jgi:hypothetical protein
MYLYDATRERILLAERVAECRHATPNAQTSSKRLETFASFEELDFNNVRVDRAICARRFVTVIPQDVWVELG